jgi:hypothetical protein
MTHLRTFSYGGGVQSTAALVLAAQRKIDFPIFLFSNVGDDSEHPATLSYVNDIAEPFAAKHGLDLIELHRRRRDGTIETIYERLVGNNRSIVIPVRLSTGAPGNRACTIDFKVRVIARWQRQHGATCDNPAVTGLGISMDELQRMRTNSAIPYQTLDYPLIDLRLTRRDCIQIIENAGLPVPPKSACWFCPFHRHSHWNEMLRNEPELFSRAVDLEQRINHKRSAIGRDVVTFHRSGKPLAEAVKLQLSLFEDEPCDSGFCFV